MVFDDLTAHDQQEVVRLSQLGLTCEKFDEHRQKQVKHHHHEKNKKEASMTKSNIKAKKMNDVSREKAANKNINSPDPEHINEIRNTSTFENGPGERKDKESESRLLGEALEFISLALVNSKNVKPLENNVILAQFSSDYIDRLNATVQRSATNPNPAGQNCLQDDQVKKLHRLASPEMEEMDKRVNVEVNHQLQRLEKSVVAINLKVDRLLAETEGRHLNASITNAGLDAMSDCGSARDDSTCKVKSYHPMKQSCPIHGRPPMPVAKETLDRIPCDLDDSGDSTKRWLPTTANRYFLDPNHRVKTKRRHPLQWTTLQEDRQKSARKKPIDVQFRPFKAIPQANKSQLTLKRIEDSQPAFLINPQRWKTQKEQTKSEKKSASAVVSQGSVGRGRQVQGDYTIAQTKQSQAGNIKKPETAAPRHIQRKQESLTRENQRPARRSIGLQARRDQALLTRKKLDVVIQQMSPLPWHKKRLTPTHG